MKVLLDECLPRKLKDELTDHEVLTVPQMGWAAKKNGELLKLMAGKFDVFITIDGNLQHQQQLEEMPLAFVVLVAESNRLEDLKPLVPKILSKLQAIKAGDVVEIE